MAPGRSRGWLVRRALAAADVVGLITSFLLAQWLFAPEGRVADGISPSAETLLFLSTLPAWLVLAKLYGLYDRDEERTDHSTVDDLPGVFQMLTAGVWLFFIVTWLMAIVVPVPAKLAAFWLLAVVLVSLLRAGSRALCRRRAAYLQNTVIVGAGGMGQTIARKIRKHPEYGLRVVGFVDEIGNRNGNGVVPGYLDETQRLRALITSHAVDRLIFTQWDDSGTETLELIRSLRDLPVQLDVLPRFHELIAPGANIHSVEGVPLLGLAPSGLSRSSALLKRALDVGVAAAGLVLLSPLLALAALTIKLDSPGPVIFAQTRVGRGGRKFRIHKFRTMAADAEERKPALAHLNKHRDSKMFKLEGDPRVTRVGRLLRRSGIDELPQLWNVLRGEMSLVGPRPLIPEEAGRVKGWGEQRLTLKPGITGLWQVLGSSSIAFDEMLDLDYLYVTSWSPWGDIRLILRTLPVVLRAANEVA
jgi:exopolysaccharide biosynthesis polyprenyl glycosylphosphotransferase